MTTEKALHFVNDFIQFTGIKLNYRARAWLIDRLVTKEQVQFRQRIVPRSSEALEGQPVMGDPYGSLLCDLALKNNRLEMENLKLKERIENQAGRIQQLQQEIIETHEKAKYLAVRTIREHFGAKGILGVLYHTDKKREESEAIVDKLVDAFEKGAKQYE